MRFPAISTCAGVSKEMAEDLPPFGGFVTLQFAGDTCPNFRNGVLS
jgi:hypothetical protein